MADIDMIEERASEKLRGRARRSCNLEGRPRGRGASGKNSERMGARSIAEQCSCRQSHADGNAHFH
jgi:hypothetical protein